MKENSARMPRATEVVAADDGDCTLSCQITDKTGEEKLQPLNDHNIDQQLSSFNKM